ncbi:MAG: hypothetical protein QG567_2001 [Campylobacterota bacterium]|nr:hypothetical protein [Campylobacterota bacterium]
MMKVVFIFIFAVITAYAKPVKIDEILTDKNELVLDLSVSYHQTTTSENGVTSITYQTAGGDFVSIPTFIGSGNENIDHLNYGIGIRYGLTKKLELMMSLDGYSQWSRSFIAGVESEVYGKEFSSLSTALSYEVLKEGKYPALLLGFSSNVVERVRFSGDKTKDMNGKNISLFATSYYTVDPIVFLIQTSFQKFFKKESGDDVIQTGDVISLAPEIYFAVNPYTSINWGVQWIHQKQSRYNDFISEPSSSNMVHMVGVTYELDSKTTLVFDTKHQSSASYDQSTLDFKYSYRF